MRSGNSALAWVLVILGGAALLLLVACGGVLAVIGYSYNRLKENAVSRVNDAQARAQAQLDAQRAWQEAAAGEAAAGTGGASSLPGGSLAGGGGSSDLWVVLSNFRRESSGPNLAVYAVDYQVVKGTPGACALIIVDSFGGTVLLPATLGTRGTLRGHVVGGRGQLGAQKCYLTQLDAAGRLGAAKKISGEATLYGGSTAAAPAIDLPPLPPAPPASAAPSGQDPFGRNIRRVR
jgi:hypothetical protein